LHNLFIAIAARITSFSSDVTFPASFCGDERSSASLEDQLPMLGRIPTMKSIRNEAACLPDELYFDAARRKELRQCPNDADRNRRLRCDDERSRCAA